MKETCVACDKAIDTEKDKYFTGESLGEYWCEECVYADWSRRESK